MKDRKKNEGGFVMIAACLMFVSAGVLVASGAANLKDPIVWSKLKTGVAEYKVNP